MKKRGRIQENEEVKMNEEGKFIFGNDEKPNKKKKIDDEDEGDDEKEDDDDSDDEKKPSKPAHIINWKKNQKNKGDGGPGYSGQEFKGKSGGDVKRTGKFEPFAYVPLNPRLLNKRFVFTHNNLTY